MRTSKSLVYVLVFALALAGIGAICAAGAPKALAEPDVTMTEYPANPVYDPPVTTYDEYYPCVLYDANQFSGHGASYYYKTWYGDGQGHVVAVTYSNDGLTWTAPVQTTGVLPDGYHAQVIYIPGGFSENSVTYYYKIWYWNSSVSPYTIEAIRTADSTDGVNFANDKPLAQDPSAQLIVGNSGGWKWNSGSYGPVSLLHNASAKNTGGNPFDYTYAMYYDAATGSSERIGLGYSEDGVYWHRYGNDPVLNLGPQGAWDGPPSWVQAGLDEYAYTTFGTVIKGTDGTWRMWYSAWQYIINVGATNYGIGYATSTDGITWTKDADNPVFYMSDGKAWRDACTYTPSVLYSPTRFDGHGTACHYKMWFTGQTSAPGRNAAIGYAYSAEPVLSLQKSANPSGAIKRGDTITYTMTASNGGTGSATGCTLTDAIPGYTDYVAGSTTLNGSSVPDVGGASPLAGGMSVNSNGQPAGTIAVGSDAVATFQVRVQNALPVGSSVSNSATLTAAGQSPVQASCSNSSKSPLIALFKNGSPPGKVTRGQLLTYTIRARNDGDDAARGCKLTDSVPAYTAYVANSTTLNGSRVSDVGGTTPLVKGIKVHSGGKPAGTMAVGSRAVITYKVRVQNDLPANWPISSVATLTSDALAPVKATCTNYGQVSKNTTWYLAEGSTNWGFDCYVTIENPNDKAIHTRITYMTPHGPVAGGTFLLAPRSQGTVNPRDTLGEEDFSTKVECLEGETIAVDRTMTWTGSGAASPEAHNSVGVTAPARTWYLPEGSSAWGFECWLLVQNPNPKDTVCTLTYMIEGAAPVTVEKTLPANSRQTFSMADDIGSRDASVKVDCSLPIIPERAMYRNNRRGGHDSIGTTSAANDYYLAEGTTAWGFTTYVLVQNPNDTDATVTVTYMTGAGPVPQASITMPPNSRKTIRVNDSLFNRDFSTQVHGDKPIIAERAMYWDNGTGEAMHDSIGLSGPHLTFYLPDGETSNGRETWTLVQNPNRTAVTVEISYFTPTGRGNVTFTEIVPPNSRRTYNMADRLPDSRAAIRVTSKSAGKPIIVERAMYWNNRGAGTDTIGGYSD